MNMTNNTIFITGGTSGIGRGLAEAFHKLGNQVVIGGRRKALLEQVTAANPGMRWVELDVADPASIAAAAERLKTEFPSLNVLINNAGIMPFDDPAGAVDEEALLAQVNTNLLGPIRLTAALLPHLRRQASATVVNITSGLAFVPLVVTPTYNATKAALHSWSESLRAQLADTTVEVIELAPPAVATDLMPGHAENPNSMPLDAYIEEVMGLFRAHPRGPEICVQRVLFLREAERRGEYAQVFAALNGAH